MPVPSRSIVAGSGVAAGDGDAPGLNGGASIGAIAGAGPAPAGTTAALGGTTAGAAAAPPGPPTPPPPGAGALELPPPPLLGDLGGDGRAAGGVALSAGAFWFWNVEVEG
jgi:hypothetical protein